MNANKKQVLNEIIKLTIIAIIIGLVIAIYKYAVHFVLHISEDLYTSNNYLNRIIFIFISLLLMILGYKIVTYDGNVQTSGLSQIDVHVKHNVRQIKWYKSFPLMIVSSLISFFCGAPVDCEGPSGFLGGMVSMCVNEKTNECDDDIFVGIGGAVSSVLLSPFSGISYVFEECVEKFKIKLLCKVLYVSTVSSTISYLINKEKIVSIVIDTKFELKYYLFIIPLFIIMIFSSKMIKKLTVTIKTFINNHYQNKFLKYRYIYTILISIVLVNILPVVSGSGVNIIDSIDNTIWYLAIIYLIIRLLLFVFLPSSMVTGGIILPSLTIGALIGYLYYLLINNLFSVPSDLINTFVLISMMLLFAFINKAPITAFILTLTFSSYSKNIIILSIVMLIITFILTKVLNVESILDKRTKLLKTSRKG